jgi:hypothetical protein
MVFVFPDRLRVAEDLELAAAVHGVADDFGEKGAAAAGTDERVDFGEQVFGEEDVGAFAGQVRKTPTAIVSRLWELV